MLTLDQPKSWTEIYSSVKKQNKNKDLSISEYIQMHRVIYTYILSHLPTRLGLVIPDLIAM